MEVERHSGSESEDEEFSPEEEVVDEPQFTTDEIEDELSDDADAIAHLEQEMQAAGLRQRVLARGAEDDEGDDFTPAAVSPSGRPMRGAAVRATKAIAEQRETTRSVRSDSGRSGLFAAVGLLALLVLAFVAATYLASRPSVSEDSCGLQVHEFARALGVLRYSSEVLRYAKAQYAPSPLENVNQISTLLYAKQTTRPTVMLFVSGNSPERRQAMNTFVEGLASVFYNQTDDVPMTAVYKFDDPQATNSSIQKPIVDRLRVCNRGLFAVDANVMLEHFDLLETAMEDNVAYIVASNGEQVPTNGAVFIVMATLPEEVLRRLTRQTHVDSVVAQQVMDKHRPRWTKRFSQRLQDVFIF